MSLSETIRNAVLISGLSQRQIEEETGLGRGLLARFLSGERDIQLSTADRLADYFGLTLAPADSTNKLLLHVLSEVRHMSEKARDSAILTVEELDALRRRLSLSQSGPIVGVEMEATGIMIAQPRKKGRPKITVRGVRDFDLAESAPIVSTAGGTPTEDDASDASSGDPASSRVSRTTPNGKTKGSV
jgi:transcriptional regulator with XRE-family HTH domain